MPTSHKDPYRDIRVDTSEKAALYEEEPTSGLHIRYLILIYSALFLALLISCLKSGYQARSTTLAATSISYKHKAPYLKKSIDAYKMSENPCAINISKPNPPPMHQLPKRYKISR